VTAVQHSGYCDVVNWIQKIVLHLTCHGELKALTLVIKCRPFRFVEKKCDGAVSLFVCLSLFNQSILPAGIIQVQMKGELIFCFIE